MYCSTLKNTFISIYLICPHEGVQSGVTVAVLQKREWRWWLAATMRDPGSKPVFLLLSASGSKKKKVKQNIPFSACSNKHELSSPLFHQENHCQSVIPYHFSPWPPSVNSQQGCPTSSRTSSVHSPHSFQNDLSNSNMSYSLTTVPFLPTHRGFIFKLFI